MSAADSIYDLYRAQRGFLWVEDELTQEALRILWGQTGVAIAVAGSKKSVLGLVNGAPEELKDRVLGLVDCDFESSNYPTWSAMGAGRVYRTDVLEFENYLLDFEALAAESRAVPKKSAADVELVARTAAAKHVWWMACRRTLDDAKREVQGSFPSDPAIVAVSNASDATQHILSSTAWKTVPAAWASWDAARVMKCVNEWEAVYRGLLGAAKWAGDFSGKELFRAVRSDRTLVMTGESKKRLPSEAQRDLDFARRVVGRIKAMNRVPAPLAQLRAHLLARLPR